MGVGAVALGLGEWAWAPDHGYGEIGRWMRGPKGKYKKSLLTGQGKGSK